MEKGKVGRALGISRKKFPSCSTFHDFFGIESSKFRVFYKKLGVFQAGILGKVVFFHKKNQGWSEKISSSPRGCSGILGFGMDPGGKFPNSSFFPHPKICSECSGNFVGISEPSSEKRDLGLGKPGLDPGFLREILKKTGLKIPGRARLPKIPKNLQKIPQNPENSSLIAGKASQKSCWEKGGGARSFSMISAPRSPCFLWDFSLEKPEQIPI